MTGRAGTGRPDYGVDAPGVIRGLIGGGLAGMAAGWAANFLGGSPWITVPGAIIAIGATVPVVLGLSMIAYAARGKHRLRDWMLDRHSWRGDEVVLDIGTGRGLMAVGAARRVPRGRVIAIDIWRDEDLSDNGAAGLIGNAKDEGVAGRIDVRDMDARSIDLPDASVDIILSVLCLHNIEPEAERAKALGEIVRLLKPGGRALISDYIATRSYARYLRAHGMEVSGPISTIGVALTSMAVVDVRKPVSN